MATKPTAAKADQGVRPVCGIIMPIAPMLPKYEAGHWSDVRKVFDAAINKAGMLPQIVSDSFESDVIQQRIITNLYDNPVVVCDVSGLNPNVMFELGMRITFKQPVIIVTDDLSSIPFDTKIIEHIGYPRDLHIHQANEFIDKLSDRILHLYEQKQSGSFKSFIEAFGTFEILEPTKKIVESDQLILDRLDELDRTINRMADHDNRMRHDPVYNRKTVFEGIRIDFIRQTPEELMAYLVSILRSLFPSSEIEMIKLPKGQAQISVNFGGVTQKDRHTIESQIQDAVPQDLASRFSIRWL